MNLLSKDLSTHKKIRISNSNSSLIRLLCSFSSFFLSFFSCIQMKQKVFEKVLNYVHISFSYLSIFYSIRCHSTSMAFICILNSHSSRVKTLKQNFHVDRRSEGKGVYDLHKIASTLLDLISITPL